jgi:hypothetical protein
MTSYNRPRRLNIVSFLFILALIAGGYAAYKFVPVYWQARQIDSAVDEIIVPAAQLPLRNEDVRTKEAEDLLNRVAAKAHELGAQDQPDQPVEVWWDPDYGAIHVKYRVIVEHPAVLKPTILNLERVRKVPKR